MKVILADDHPIFRSGLQFLLQSSFEEVEIQAYENGSEVIENIPHFNPDIVLLDIDMPVKNGLETCSEIQQEFPDLAVIILSIHKTTDVIKLAFYNGAKGYLIKDNTSEEIVECINWVLAGKTYLPLVLRDQHNKREIDPRMDLITDEIKSLTPTELKVLKLVSKKYSSKDIANMLFVSPKSVENYRSRICKKLNLDARNNSLILWVMENKFLLDSDQLQ
ncbi:response regulator transcription factor [Fluviicola taffensis]|uniref:Two component transcriptional regulator, LuxR family n=1 Tax=Fluviicola taffensis (strain DSM 16823 / NCIMB 13979 / RW262) TaxID=755732 RepID=F2IAQ0_FLUTR|nr:response regulator transcription factor [Fluviicola taffensis]AEA44205.1 two component transcriptional regulator, LuxR family [Fluviicola taffensis DSM 16823]